jgi:hypothetical protein
VCRIDRFTVAQRKRWARHRQMETAGNNILRTRCLHRIVRIAKQEVGEITYTNESCALGRDKTYVCVQWERRMYALHDNTQQR